MTTTTTTSPIAELGHSYNTTHTTFQSPWAHHGTVVEGMTATEALQAAGLAGWNQRLVTPSITDWDTATTFEPGTHRYAVADTPNGPTVLGAVTDAYQPIQNEEVFTPLVEGFGQAGFAIETLGYTPRMLMSFAVFRMPNADVTVAGEAHASRLLVTKGNGGYAAATARPIMHRVACANMITGLMAKHAPVIRVQHTRHADKFVMQHAEELYGVATNWDAEVAQWADRLLAVPVTEQQFITHATKIMFGDRDLKVRKNMFDAKVAALTDAWHSPTMEGIGNNAWRAYNAVTEYEQHLRPGKAEARANYTIDNITKSMQVLGALV